MMRGLIALKDDVASDLMDLAISELAAENVG